LFLTYADFVGIVAPSSACETPDPYPLLRRRNVRQRGVPATELTPHHPAPTCGRLLPPLARAVRSLIATDALRPRGGPCPPSPPPRGGASLVRAEEATPVLETAFMVMPEMSDEAVTARAPRSL
jgi:hypothetical protein